MPSAHVMSGGSVNGHPLRCRCGHLQGLVLLPAVACRARCYCRDCQAYANVLECADRVLDAQGGTEVVATLPRQVRFSAGEDALACLSLSPAGILRWYAGCCRTPIGNTPRDVHMPYVGIVHACLVQPPPLQQSFGPLRAVVNTASARGPVRSNPVGTALALVRPMLAMGAARLGGGWRETPFFDAATGRPVREPRVLTLAERAAATPPRP